MNYDEYIADINSRRGRKQGSAIRNRFQDVYVRMREQGLLRGIKKQTLHELVNAVGDGVWEAVYKGHIVAIPGLFNMEVKQNKTRWRRRVDWFRTMKLWSEDEEAYKDKLLVRAKPTQHFLHVRHSTIGLKRAWWYYSLMLDIRPSLGKVKQIEDKYDL